MAMRSGRWPKSLERDDKELLGRSRGEYHALVGQLVDIRGFNVGVPHEGIVIPSLVVAQ